MITPFLIMPVVPLPGGSTRSTNPNYGLFNGLLRLFFGPAPCSRIDLRLPKTSIVVSWCGSGRS
jgi:hypothetical protein